MDKLDLLKIYVDIADNGSLSGAARANAISPASVTLALSKLEKLVGIKLIVRTTRKIAFTQEGERFVSECRRILTDVHETLENVSQHGEIQGTIKVTATNDFGRNRLAPLIDKFMETNPKVRIDLVLSDAIVDLVANRYDIALRMGVLKDSDLKARLLMPGRYCICASPSYWNKHGRPEKPRDLLSHNCLVLERPGSPMSQWPYKEHGKHQTIRVSGDRTANDGGTLISWAKSGAGVTLLSSIDIKEDLTAGRLESVLDEYSDEAVNLYAVHPAGAHPSRRVASFIEFLVQELNPLI